MLDADTLVVLDFETTGLSPDMGDRAIEIGAVRLRNGEVVEEFQELMNPGFRVTGFIEDYTGISNADLANADSCGAVMARFADFVGDDNMLAHNASFDKRFLDAELSRLNRHYSGEVCCSLLASRRVFIDAPNHKLGTLVDYVRIPTDGQYHRALFDAQMTAKVWLQLLDKLRKDYPLQQIPFALMQKINKTPKKAIAKLLQAEAEKQVNLGKV